MERTPFQHVRRLLGELALPAMLAAVQGAQRELLAVRGSGFTSKQRAARTQKLQVTGRALHVAAGQCALVLRACRACADALAVEVVQGYFLNLTLLLLALLGRIHALVRHAGVAALYVGQAVLRQDIGEEAKQDARRPTAPSQVRLARALGIALGPDDGDGSGGGVTSNPGEQAGGDGNGDDDDLGVALGPLVAPYPAAPAAAAPKRALLTTRVIPKGKAAAASLVGGRAMLADEYSSSSEEDEEQSPAPLPPPPPPSPPAVLEDEDKDNGEDGGALAFIIDREPEVGPPPPAKTKHQPKEAALAAEPARAVQLPAVGRTRKKKRKAGKEKPTAAPTGGGGGGSLLDDIDAIFESAGSGGGSGAKKKKKVWKPS